MHEEAKIRDEIQERTGVSSRGFLIPQKKIRKEVQGMLSAGNQRQLMVDDDDGTSAVPTTGAVPSDVSFFSFRCTNTAMGITGSLYVRLP